ncbi:MAG: prealbumin-like fold domain-containing protein [Oscillospiraceae bacterium]|nr:prealbumin-like fold domain-containing protein [Oscillospiraceae bacterium]
MARDLFDGSPAFRGHSAERSGAGMPVSGPRAADMFPNEFPPRGWASFIVYPVNAWFSTLVRDAEFALRGRGRVTPGCRVSHGGLWFHNIPTGKYALTQSRPAFGYFTTPIIPLTVDLEGNAWIDGENADGYNVPMPPAGIHLRVSDPNGQPLTGGVYELAAKSAGPNPDQAEELTRYARAEQGIIRFPKVKPGMYTLRELMPPYGYHAMPRERLALVPQSGQPRVEGLEPTEFVLVNPPLRSACFSVMIERLPGVCTAMSYGLFLLYNDHKTTRAVPDSRGLLSFTNVEPGVYTIRPERSRARAGFGAEALLRVAMDGQAEIHLRGCVGPRMRIVNASIDDIANPMSGEKPPCIDLAALQKDFLSFRRKFFVSVKETEKRVARAESAIQSRPRQRGRPRAENWQCVVKDGDTISDLVNEIIKKGC